MLPLTDGVERRWSKLEDRVVGCVVGAPLIGVSVPPHRRMRDLCVIKLDKKKFRKFRWKRPKLRCVLICLGESFSSNYSHSRAGDIPRQVQSLDIRLYRCAIRIRAPRGRSPSTQSTICAADINNPNSKNLKGGVSAGSSNAD